jgi:ribonuclease HI
MSTQLHILQINVNRSSVVTEDVLQYAVDNNVHIVLIQEPWIISSSDTYSDARSTLHNAFSFILPSPSGLRPRTLAYISKQSVTSAIHRCATSPIDPDILILNVPEHNNSLHVFNIYNERGLGDDGQRTTERILYNITIPSRSLICGDFNIHHPTWDPYNNKTQGADEFVQWIDRNDLLLMNTPGEGTFMRSNLQHDSVLDLTFSSPQMFCDNWQVLHDVGSDHYGISFNISSRAPVHSTDMNNQRWNTKLADWDSFRGLLQQHSFLFNYDNNVPTHSDLDNAAQELTDAINTAAQQSIPVMKHGAKSKPWWNDNLRQLRKDLTHAYRNVLDHNPVSKRQYMDKKNKYFNAIKEAKRTHWNNFLESEQPSTIFRAMNYTKDNYVKRLPTIQGSTSFTDKCHSLREGLFPTPPTTHDVIWNNYEQLSKWQWEPLSHSELQKACSGNIKGKTPGPDGITHEIITHAYNAIPHTFFHLFQHLLSTGYHPSCWRQATGAVLQKPNKPDYSIPKAYRVIALLNCLGKVSERIIAQRLGWLAETTDLLHHSQMGGRLKKSAIDAALSLTNEIQSSKQAGLISSALFLDIKGAFDHVSKNRLVQTMIDLGLPRCLINWVLSFLQHRQLRLSFDNQTEPFTSINAGIPQGSPVSPILFLIYIRDLFTSTTITIYSYIDDIALVASSHSVKRNCLILTREVQTLYDKAHDLTIEFDLAKTELIHFTKPRTSCHLSVSLPSGDIISPKPIVKWLGVYYDPHLTFKHHVTIRAAQARQSFQRMCRLVNIERGISTLATRQLYLSCIQTIGDYGSVLWWKGYRSLIKPLELLQNMALRKILGVFRTAPIKAMEVEAGLLPPHIRLSNQLRRYRLRMLMLPRNHPINQSMYRYQEYVIENGVPSGNKTQLSRIYDTIDPNTNAETIPFFIHPPWQQNRINTSTTNHDSNTQSRTPISFTSSDIDIYTDSSFHSKSTGIGIGLAAYDNSISNLRPIITQQFNIGPNQLVFDGELRGIQLGIKLASQFQSDKSITILSDNISAVKRITKLDNNPGAQITLEAWYNAGPNMTLKWCPSHQDITGNEYADKLAKEASTMLTDNNQSSLLFTKALIRQETYQEWADYLATKTTKYSNLYGWTTPRKCQLPRGIPRLTASAFYQLKLRHGYFKKYLHIRGHTSTDRCVCGATETIEHLLLSCPQYRSERRELQKELNTRSLSLNLLFHTSIGIKHTLCFLKNTRISTRRWHLERNLEDDDVGEGDIGDESGVVLGEG